MGPILLYNYFRSSTSYRARLALHYKELSFDYVPINILKGEQRTADYLKINPLGGVPTLAHNGKYIPESFAIIEYLDDVFSQNPLLPKDPYLKARVRQVCEIVNSFMHPIGNLKMLAYMEKKHGYTLEQKEEWVGHWLHQGLEALETTLKEFSGKYSFGDEVTASDLFVVPQILTSLRFKVDVSRYPTLIKINDNCLMLEAFKKAHPFNQIDTPAEFRKG